MSETKSFVETPYGRLDSAALEEVRNSYDTRSLLQMLDEIDELVREIGGEEGLRDQLLRLHQMAHTVINGAALSAPASGTLPELAADITCNLQDAIQMLESWIRRIAPLKELDRGQR